jgi:PilZ domain-containing protein
MFGERRNNQRTTINRVAKLVAEAGTPMGDCVVIDISDTGARLLCENFTAPDTFRLMVEGERPIREDCRVAWRLGCEVGVEFITKQREMERSDAIKRFQAEARSILRQAN